VFRGGFDDLQPPLACELPQVERLRFGILVNRRNPQIQRRSLHRLKVPSLERDSLRLEW
jgi:hypothetical protein